MQDNEKKKRKRGMTSKVREEMKRTKNTDKKKSLDSRKYNNS